MKDHANKISETIHISLYKFELILISKSAFIDASAHEIHHRIILHAIVQKTIDMIRLENDNRIFSSFSLCNRAIIRNIHRKAIGSIHMISIISE